MGSRGRGKGAHRPAHSQRCDGVLLRAPFAGTLTFKKGDKAVLDGQKPFVQRKRSALRSPCWSKTEQKLKLGRCSPRENLDLHELLTLKGRDAVEQYIVAEVLKIYIAQGQPINNKHIEILVRQMLSKVQVLDPGTSGYIEGEVIDSNQRSKAIKQHKIGCEQMLFGISRISLKTDSFLSAGFLPGNHQRTDAGGDRRTDR